MKKITILSSLLALATVGGVYATWTYASTNDIFDAFTEAKVTLEGATSSGSNGLYSVTTNLVMTIDQKSENDHTAVLNYAANNDKPLHITIRFTPAAFAPEAIKKAGVPSEYYFGTTVDMKYNIDAQGNYSATGTPTDIFTLGHVSDGNFDANVTWVKYDGEGNVVNDADTFGAYFEMTFDETAIKNNIQLSRAFVLDTKAEHDAFSDALKGNITLKVTDGVNIGQTEQA